MERTQIIVTVLDDLDLRGGLETPATEHHKLALDGHEVEIDLTAAHSKKLREFLEPHLDAGHTTKRPYKSRAAHPNASMAQARRVNKAVTEWASADGRDLPTDHQSGAWRKLVQEFRDAQPEQYAALTEAA